MMRLTLIVLLGIVLGQGPGLAVAAEKPARHFEKVGGFSWVPPKGWKLIDTSKEVLAPEMKAILVLKKKIEAKKPANRTEAEIFQLGVFETMLKAGALAKGMTHYKQAWGPGAGAPTPSIVLQDFVRTGLDGRKLKTTMADCVANYKQAPGGVTREVADSFRVVSQKKMKTDSGAGCVVLVTEFVENLLSYRQTYYMFDLGGGRFLVATCRAPWINKLDAVFAASMKTLRREKP
jgi:hypothetical protein